MNIPMQQSSSLEHAILNHLRVEYLKGDNKYEAGNFGKQDARKFTPLKKLPPVQ